MPCLDYYDDHPEMYFKEVTEPALKGRVAFAESALCAALTCIEENLGPITEFVDCDAAGVSEHALKCWFTNHRANDARVKEKIRVAALAKLTAEERTLLGL